MIRTELHSGWTVRAVAGPGLTQISEPVAGSVPGCVHTDLLAAGLIPDPYLDRNEETLAWIGRTDWEFSTDFDWEPGQSDGRVELVCDGLDTVATVTLNGAVVGNSENMHRRYRFDVSGALRPGSNELSIRFAAALDFAERRAQEYGDLPCAYPMPFNFIRKMACNFGWDWGPTLVTAGIWKPIALETTQLARLAEVRPIVDVDRDAKAATVRVEVGIDRVDVADLSLQVVLRHQGVEVASASGPVQGDAASLELAVADPKLWWPRTHGAQPLYDLEVTLSSDGSVVHSWSKRIGLRTITIDRSEDSTGAAFTFVVNGEPVFIRGANWIPDDCFPTRIDAARYRRRIEQCVQSNMNMLRIWGGGIYEADDFYDACDEAGIMVWQDFLFACAAYPETGVYPAEIEAEARDNIARLMPHPSLALWNGCNENIWGWYDWNWQGEVGERGWGLGYYTELLPRLVGELDPKREYNPGSPWSYTLDIHPDDPKFGLMHIWDVWNQLGYQHYRDYIPRFASEFGFQGPPTWSTLTRAIHDTPLAPTSPGMLAHQKAEDGQGKLSRGLAGHLPEPDDFADWHFATSLNQARAVAFGVEHMRSHAPRCMGSIVWQINDCWPVASWAAVDGDERVKPLWYELRRVYADRLLTIQPRDGGLALAVCNDSPQPWRETVTVELRSFDGQVRRSGALAIDVPARSVACLAIPATLAAPQYPTRELLVASTGDTQALHLFVEDVAAELPPAEFDAEAVKVAGGYEVTITARTLLRDLCLFADRVDPAAEVDDMVVTLLAGQTRTFRIRSTQEVDPEAFCAPEVIRCVNQLV